MVQENHMQVHFDAKSVNEGLARMVVTAFMTNMNPTLEQMPLSMDTKMKRNRWN